MVGFGQGTRKAIAAIALAFLIVGGALFGFILLGVGIPDSGKLQVVASLYPLAYFSGQIGGDRVNVYTLIPDNVEPHSFEPTPVDLLVVSKAEILVFNGEGFEPWIQDFLNPGFCCPSENIGEIRLKIFKIKMAVRIAGLEARS